MPNHATDEALSSGKPTQGLRLSDEMIFTLECVTCKADLRTTDPQTQVVIGHYNGGQLAACQGECARQACGHPNGLPDQGPVLALERRLEEWKEMEL